MLTLHRARFVLPILAPPIADGAVLVEGTGWEAIVRAVGPAAELQSAAAATIDHGEAVLLPGLDAKEIGLCCINLSSHRMQ